MKGLHDAEDDQYLGESGLRSKSAIKLTVCRSLAARDYPRVQASDTTPVQVLLTAAKSETLRPDWREEGLTCVDALLWV